MKRIFLGFTVSILALSLSSCIFHADSDYVEGRDCAPNPLYTKVFLEYCHKGAPVWCVNGTEQRQDVCTDDTFCVEFIEPFWSEYRSLGIAGCYDPHPSGPDTCLIIGDYKSHCQNNVMDHYDCLEANDGLSYWVLVESEKCASGCDISGTHCN